MDTSYLSFVFTYRNHSRIVFCVAARTREDADRAFMEVVGDWPSKFIEVEVS